MGDVELVPLTEREVRLAGHHAVDRRVERLIDRQNDRVGGCVSDGIAGDFAGVLGEMAFAKWLDRYPTGIGAAGAGDVGRWFEVRTVTTAGAALQVYQKDRQQAHVLAQVGNPLEGVQLVGWLHPEQELGADWWKPCSGQRADCYLVPRVFLKPMAELIKKGVR